MPGYFAVCIGYNTAELKQTTLLCGASGADNDTFTRRTLVANVRCPFRKFDGLLECPDNGCLKWVIYYYIAQTQ